MKKFFIILSVFSFVLLLNAGKTSTFHGLMDPKCLVVDNEQVIISDYPHVYLYSLKDYSLIKKIGSEGKGPGEFYMRRDNQNLKDRGLVVSVCPDNIAVNSMYRISYFSRKGDYLGERKLPFGANAKFLSLCPTYEAKTHAAAKNSQSKADAPDVIGSENRPLCDNLLGFLPKPRKGTLSVALFDSQLNRKNEIFNCDYWFNLSRKEQANFFDRASDTLSASVYAQKIFFFRGGAPDFAIDVFDFTGSKLYTVRHNVEKIKIPPGFVDEIHDHFKIKFKRSSQFFIKNLNLPQYFPAIRDSRTVENKIYVFTFKKSPAGNEILIFDLSGKFLTKTFLPVKARNPERLYPFSIYKDTLYQLVENEEKETWELEVTPIKKQGANF